MSHFNVQVFKAHGLTQINPLDEKFNPNEHEAVVQQVIYLMSFYAILIIPVVNFYLFIIYDMLLNYL